MTGLNGFVPPHNTDAEKSVIGAALQDGKALKKAVAGLRPDDFYSPENTEIFSTMVALNAGKSPVDVMTVGNLLAKRGTLKSTGGTAYLLDAYRFVPTVVNVDAYIGIVQDMSRRRRLIEASRKFMARIYGQVDEIDAAIGDMRAAMRFGLGNGKVTTASEVAAMTYDYLDKRSKGEVRALMTGISSLDNMTGGLLGGDLFVIGARPGVGKSALAMEIVLNVARKGGHVLVLSREMQAEQYGIRAGSRLCELNGTQLKNAEIGDQQWEQVGLAYDEFSQLPIEFLFSTRNVEELQAIAQERYDDKGLDLIVVDYMQLMGTAAKTDKRYQEVGAVSRGLKELATTLKVPVIALAQVKRPSDGKAAPCPMLQDLRESGDIEQDADTVMFLHRPDTLNDSDIPSNDVHVCTLIEQAGRQYLVAKIAKQRMGSLGTVGLDFDPAHMAIRPVDGRAA